MWDHSKLPASPKCRTQCGVTNHCTGAHAGQQTLPFPPHTLQTQEQISPVHCPFTPVHKAYYTKFTKPPRLHWTNDLISSLFTTPASPRTGSLLTAVICAIWKFLLLVILPAFFSSSDHWFNHKIAWRQSTSCGNPVRKSSPSLEVDDDCIWSWPSQSQQLPAF